ncbi:hypothetical protein O181_023399 [Austropuccinia psidii MF-1]|uniref:Uncharacterized protein n=1 Tax=Austropuccinia psidii MF-1 TaxID=1389203 RepID=A0A9Q3GYM0_9BASI|nr:hypothetical protein [Austropuccinia psidii MF-1]
MNTNIIFIYFRCPALCVLSGPSPTSATPQQAMLFMLANKHTRNAHSLSDPSNHTARGVLSQDALVRTPLWSTMMKEFLSGNGLWDPKQAEGNNSQQLDPYPQVSIGPPPPRPPSNCHFTP